MLIASYRNWDLKYLFMDENILKADLLRQS